MKKLIAVIPIAILIILLSRSSYVLADVAFPEGTYILIGGAGGAYRGYNSADPISYNLSGTTLTFSSSSIIYEYIFTTGSDEVPTYEQILNGSLLSTSYSITRYYVPAVNIYIVSGSFNGSGINTETYPNLPQPEPDPSWWETLWDTFNDYFTNPIPGGWIKNLIDKVFGDDENDTTISDSVDFTNPTLTPAPTPIPYTTVVIPKTDSVTGDTYYETNYYYNNPSGTPVIQPYPPTNTPSTNSPSGGTEYIPVNGDPYSIPFVNWLTTTTIGDSNYDGLDSIGDGMTSVDEIGSEYTDGIGAASDSTSALPTSWLLLIGIAAAIPLLAGIISRFLS